MRPIRKGSEPAELKRWKALASADVQPSYADLPGDVKAATRSSLLKEQGFICCYCESPVSGAADSHIEHLDPQSKNPERALDFGNMLCSCQGELPVAPGHCGHARGNSSVPVHPLMPDCRSYFWFDPAGQIHPTDDPERAPDASKTIRVLKLDAPKLVRDRRKAVEGLLPELDGTAVDIAALVAEKDSRDAAGRFLPFCSTLVAVLRAYGG